MVSDTAKITPLRVLMQAGTFFGVYDRLQVQLNALKVVAARTTPLLYKVQCVMHPFLFGGLLRKHTCVTFKTTH